MIISLVARHAEYLGCAYLAAFLLSGCTATRTSKANYAKAPGLHEDAPLGGRGGANPNAPYTVIDHSVRLVKRPAQLDVNAAPVCEAADLGLFESGAHVDGERRSVRLNLVNHAKQACRLSGYPAISLLRKDGSLMGSVSIEKVTGTTLEAAFHAKTVPNPEAAGPSPYVLLTPAGEATFEVGWTSGEKCDQVSSIVVAAPGTVQSFTVKRAFSVCEGRILVTALGNGDQL